MTEKSQTTEAERRKHVESAIANSRIEGLPPPSRDEQDIFDGYIRGEIRAEDLVDAMTKTLGISSHVARDD